jgi:ribonucleotide monophosphatase NagD (HAD superfamily)
LGPGPFVFALEAGSLKKALVLGKPEAEFFEAAMKHVGCDDCLEAVMIGDVSSYSV